MLDLIDEGYFPISVDICTKNKSSREYDIRHNGIENYECKEVEKDEGYYTEFYLKLSDAEDYLNRGNKFCGYNAIAKKKYINLMKRKEKKY